MTGYSRGLLSPLVHARRTAGDSARGAEDWSRTWVCVGFADQLARAGDILPATVGSHPLHIRRADDDTLTAALNARPFGSCRSVPVQCTGARKVRCPNASCAFSRDPDVLSPTTSDGARLLPQFVGTDPTRLLPVPLEQWGPLLFVRLSQAPGPTPHEALAEVAEAFVDLPGPPGQMRAHAILSLDAAVSWREGGRALAEAVAARSGEGPLVADASPRSTRAAGITRLVPAAGAPPDGFLAFVVAPHLVLLRVAGTVLAAVMRPVAPGSVSVLAAVLRPDGAADRDPTAGAVSWWQEALLGLGVNAGHQAPPTSLRERTER